MSKKLNLEKINKDVTYYIIKSLLEHNLISQNELTNEESKNIIDSKLDEVIIRCAHDFINPPEIIPDEAISKVRRMIWLNETVWKWLVNLENRQTKIKNTIDEMTEYLANFKNHFPEVLWFILCWSRMDPKKLPAKSSDMDIIIICKNGFNVNHKEKKWEENLAKMHDYYTNNFSKSEFPIGPISSISINNLNDELNNPNENILKWWLNYNAIKYIWDNDIFINNEINNSLKTPKFINFKNDFINNKKIEIFNYLEKKCE